MFYLKRTTLANISRMNISTNNLHSSLTSTLRSLYKIVFTFSISFVVIRTQELPKNGKFTKLLSSSKTKMATTIDSSKVASNPKPSSIKYL